MFALLRRAACAAALLCAWHIAALADAAAPALTKPDVDAWLDGFMPFALQQGDIAGAVVVVVKDGSVLTQRGYGYSDVATREPMDPERTLLRVGSVSKLFTWTALMQLVERGSVALDADVNTYLDFTIPAREGKPITVRDLMTHTPGFEEQLKNALTYDAASARPFEALLKEWIPERIFAAGTMPAYSNYGTALAGYIVQRVSGVPFNEYLQAHVLGPLGMTSATFEQPLPSHLQARMAKGYRTASTPERPFEIVGLAPAGALSTPASDVAKFMIAHLQQGRLGDVEILLPQTVTRMHSTPLTILPRVDRMLLGFWEANYKGRRVIAHGGDTQWFHSDLRLYIDDGVGMFVAFNSMGKGIAAIDTRIELFEQFADRYLPVPGWSAGPGVDGHAAREHARLIAGHYMSSRRSESSFMSLLNLAGGIDVVDYRDGTIGVSMIRNGSGEPRRWHEVDSFVWRLDGSERLLSAEVRDGAIARFSFDEVSPFMTFERPPAWRGSGLRTAFLAALMAMLATAIAWPASALARRHFGVPSTRSVQDVPAIARPGSAMAPDHPSVPGTRSVQDVPAIARPGSAMAPDHPSVPSTGAGRDATAHRWLRIASIAGVLMWTAWGATIGFMMSDLANLSPRIDGWLWTLHVLSIVVVLGGVAASAWHTTRTLRSQRGWFATTRAVLMSLAMLVSLWVAVACNVLTSGVNY